MADNSNVIDELIVRLRLDAEQYKNTEHTINIIVQNTEKKQRERDEKAKRREHAQNKRWKELIASGKRLALIGGAVATAVTGTITTLTGFELGLRRQAVSTGLSNRQMQAWGSTARRLGADADAGAQAVANLAKEQKQFRLTGQAPTLQALARMGVNVSPSSSIEDILASAQNVYRRAAPAQRQQMEAALSAQGVSSDLILMIKSNANALQTYQKSYNEASSENRKALDGVTDSLAALKASSVSLANTLLTVLGPGIKSFASWVSEAAADASAFTDKINAAGGGLEGLQTVLDAESPILGTALKRLADVVDVVRYGLHQLASLIPSLTGAHNWAEGINQTIADRAKADPHSAYGLLYKLQSVGHFIKDKASGVWSETVESAHGAGYNIEASSGKPRGNAVTGQALMSNLITKHGLTVAQAAAVVANWKRESGLNPGAFNAAGGGQGARGLSQWRGARIDAFKARYGVTPDKATIDQQIDFMLNDPYERSKLNQAFRSGGDAQKLGMAYSRVYEAHGKVAEDRRRGQLAAQLAAQYRTANPNAAGNPINIGTVNVQANDATAFVGSMQRLATTQNYNAANR